MNNNIVVNLSKVSYACLIWTNQHNNLFRNSKPKSPTVNGSTVNNDYASYHHSYPNETLIERARRLDILDRWEPVLKLQLSNSHRLTYRGKKALSLWNAWKAKIYGKKKIL